MMFQTVGLTLVLALGGTAQADETPYECDNRYNPCGAPEQTGGGGGGGGTVLVNNTDLGETYQSSDDYDDDGIEDNYDNCPFVANPDQADDDGDLVGTLCDNCPSDVNADQRNLGGDLLGNACDLDLDGDGLENSIDVCIERPDPLQRDTDNDGAGDACDDDMDNDGIPNLSDNCPLVANADQLNEDPDQFGDACDEDDDADGIRNTFDNCQWVSNDIQTNLDEDAFGDACDTDRDGDEIIDLLDNCPAVFNPEQTDIDRDGLGEDCDDRFCFVVFGDKDNCLDPTDPFTVYLPDAAADTGDTIRLRLFANQSNQALDYSFTVIDAPRGSSATVDNGTGAASQSTPFEYHYLEGREVLFTPDKPGTYTIQVTTTLVHEDPVTGQAGVVETATMSLDVSGEAVPAGCACSSGGLHPLAGWALLPMLAVVARRRQD